ncbi:MAG TPA: T9SS type A sorting domain-containing protein [Bacteroidia bacterium]
MTYPQGFPEDCKAEWTVNGITYPSNDLGKGLLYNFDDNGLYTFCIKITDTVRHCDTTYCKDIYMNCGGSCPNWKKELSYQGVYVSDSCPEKYFYGAVGLKNQKAYSFLWTCNSDTINDKDTFNNYVPESNGKQKVCVRITDTLTGCDTSICYDLYYNCFTTGIGELSVKQMAMNVYPNPAVSELNFESNANGSAYKIYDGHGKVLLSGLSIPGMNKVDIANLPAGIYYFSLTEDHIMYHSIFVHVGE